MNQPSLFLIPVTLGETPVETVIPTHNIEIIKQLRYFIVENVRSARRFLKSCAPEIVIDDLTFYELNKHTHPEKVSTFLAPMKSGFDVAIISEAGCPAVADPGADVVAIAQQKNYRVVPLVGPSSILMALMASGFNGQSFAFQGYLPIHSAERIKEIKRLETRSYQENQTQIFIETPYRNQKLAEDLLLHCKPQTKLCIAMNISLENEYIVTRPIHLWKNNLPEMHKQLCVFLIHKG